MQICPYCKSKSTRKKGKTKLGYQQYFCKDCKKHWSDNPNGRGRPPKGDRPMTDAERARRYRKRRKENNQ